VIRPITAAQQSSSPPSRVSAQEKGRKGDCAGVAFRSVPEHPPPGRRQPLEFTQGRAVLDMAESPTAADQRLLPRVTALELRAGYTGRCHSRGVRSRPASVRTRRRCASTRSARRGAEEAVRFAVQRHGVLRRHPGSRSHARRNVCRRESYDAVVGLDQLRRKRTNTVPLALEDLCGCLGRGRQLAILPAVRGDVGPRVFDMSMQFNNMRVKISIVAQRFVRGEHSSASTFAQSALQLVRV
jgi:hypothetical protein